MLYQCIVLSMVVAARAWVVPTPAPAACAARGVDGSRFAQGPSRFGPVCMDEDGVAAAPAAAGDEVSDFTEDLLDALTTDDAPFVEEPAQFYKPSGGAELAPLGSFVNGKSVDAIRSKYAMHENDTGSTQVQIAVLTARIAYMTKHMESNRKDYSSLRGLTAMVTRRRKLLEFLLREDLSEFKRLTSELGIRTNQLLKPKLGGARGRRV